MGRIAICRVDSGTLRRGAAVAWCRIDGSIKPAKVGTITVTDALTQVDVEDGSLGQRDEVDGGEGCLLPVETLQIEELAGQHRQPGRVFEQADLVRARL